MSETIYNRITLSCFTGAMVSAWIYDVAVTTERRNYQWLALSVAVIAGITASVVHFRCMAPSTSARDRRMAESKSG